MTTERVPYRFELTLEIPATVEQTWDAIATARGVTAGMCPTHMEPGAGGSITFELGPEMSSTAGITGWEPGRRLEYEEEWASLMGHAGAPVAPLVTEFLVEAVAGGTCVVRVISSALGTGADWEDEFWSEMDTGWAAMLDNLRLYLTHFPGQDVDAMDARVELTCGVDEAVPAIARALGADRVGQRVAANGVTGVVERRQDRHLLVRTETPVTGFVWFFAFAQDDRAMVQFAAHLYGEGAGTYVERARDTWAEWIRSADHAAAPPAAATV